MLTLERLLPREKLNGSPTRTPTKYPSGTIWPHGEFSLGSAQRRPDGGEWHDDPFVGLGVDDVAMAERVAAGVPFDLSDVPNSHRELGPRGLHGITGYGQQMIKACGYLLQEQFPRHRKTLGTVTLPPMDEVARREVVAAWPELTRQYLQWLGRRLIAAGLPELVCSVTEVQPRRLQSTGAGYLHWHALWLNHPGKTGNWAVDPNEVRTFLDSLLIRVCPSYPGGFINVDTKPIEGVVASYLAKYMSKGKQQVAEAMEDWGEGNCPRTWWNMSAKARKLVKSRTFKGARTGALLEVVLHNARSADIDLSFCFLRRIELEFDGCLIPVGWRGRFTEIVHRHVDRLLQSLHMERLESIAN